MRHLVGIFLILRSITLLILFRFRFRNIALVDFDFTLVQNHFNWVEGHYIIKNIEMDASVLKLVESKNDFLRCIFTARGLRSKRFILEFTQWKDHFHLILNCGSTVNKMWLVKNIVSKLYVKVFWIDDLRDVDFDSRCFKNNSIGIIPLNVEFLLWRK